MFLYASLDVLELFADCINCLLQTVPRHPTTSESRIKTKCGGYLKFPRNHVTRKGISVQSGDNNLRSHAR